LSVISVLPFAAIAVVGVGQWLFDRTARVRVDSVQLGRMLASVVAVSVLAALGLRWSSLSSA